MEFNPFANWVEQEAENLDERGVFFVSDESLLPLIYKKFGITDPSVVDSEEESMRSEEHLLRSGVRPNWKDITLPSMLKPSMDALFSTLRSSAIFASSSSMVSSPRYISIPSSSVPLRETERTTRIPSIGSAQLQTVE